MFDIIAALSQTPLPGLLAFAGLVFIFLSIGGKLGAQIVTDNIQKKYAGILGTVLLIVSISMFVLSATFQIHEPRRTHIETEKKEAATTTQTYKLRPELPTNKPISQVVELEWTYFSSGQSKKCTHLSRTEYIITIIGLDSDGEPSVATRETIEDLSKETCTNDETQKTQISESHGELEGHKLLARKTEYNSWAFDEFPGATEKQQSEMKLHAFMEPFAGLPSERIPIGEVVVYKDQDISLGLGTAIPGSKKGTVGIKFNRVINGREPIAQVTISMDISINTVIDNGEELNMTMALNGGGRIALSKYPKMLVTANMMGIIKSNAGDSEEITEGPAKMKLTVMEI
jgi:hypothetical protein